MSGPGVINEFPVSIYNLGNAAAPSQPADPSQPAALPQALTAAAPATAPTPALPTATTWQELAPSAGAASKLAGDFRLDLRGELTHAPVVH
jgi:hypothetical protein